MDTSKKYVLMCQKAEEIQKLMPTEEKYKEEDFGSFYYFLNSDYLAMLHEDNDTGWILIGSYGETDYSSVVWLPRQDQLQTIYLDWLNDKFGLWSMLNDFQEFVFGRAIDGDGNDWGPSHIPKDETYKQFTSVEQLWLAFVMKTKYNKVWNVSEWESAQ